MSERAAAVAALIAEWDTPSIPGGIIAVAEGDELVCEQSFGLANVEFAIPWTLDTRYRIASVTKQFVGTAILLLEDDGLLRLDDDVRLYLPEMPVYGNVIIIRHLLQMTSGIKSDENLLADFAGASGPHTLAYLYHLVTRQRSLNFPPGQHVMYSDSNYRLAALIIERVTGQSFEDALRRLIFTPLGMHDSSAPAAYSVVQPRLAYLYDDAPDGTLRRNEDGIEMSGDGAIISTVADLLRWNAHLRHGLLGRLDLRERWTTVATLPDGTMANYGLGIRIGQLRGHVVWEHGGLFGTHLLRIPDADLTVIVFRNYAQISAGHLARQVAEISLRHDPSTGSQHVRPAPDWFSDNLGRYIQPERGYVLDLEMSDGRPVARLMGNSATLTPTSNGELVAPGEAGASIRGLRWRATAAVVEVDAGDGIWLTLLPAESPPSLPAQPEQYTGSYYSDEIDAWQRVVSGDDCLHLLLDRGQSPLHHLRLTPLGHDVFAATSEGAHYRSSLLGVRFVRDADGQVIAALESIADTRDMRFERRSFG